MSEDEIRNYRRLWGEVLIIAIKDALWPEPKSPGRNNTGKTTSLIQWQARSWVRTRDFATVCALAGFEPEFIRGHVEPLLSAPPERQRAFLSGLGLAGTLKMSDAQRGKRLAREA